MEGLDLVQYGVVGVIAAFGVKYILVDLRRLKAENKVLREFKDRMLAKYGASDDTFAVLDDDDEEQI